MLAGKKRQVLIGIAVAVTIVAVAFVMFVARPATEPAPVADPAAGEAAAAVAVPTTAEVKPAVDPEVEALPRSRQHVRKSNIRLLHPPEKKDYSKMSAPAAEVPTAGE